MTPSYLPHLGGVERHVAGLSLSLLKLGHDVTVITKLGSSDSSEETLDGVKVLRVDLRGGEKRRIWPWIWEHRKLFREADVVHTHDIFFWYLPWRFLFAGTKVYHTFHGWEGVFPPTPKSKLVRKITEILTSGHICVGKFICRWYGTTCPVITHGAVEQDPRPLGQPEVDAVYLGRLDQDTGFRQYLESWAQLPPGRTLQIAGDGALRQWGEEFAKQHQLEAQFLGLVGDVIPVIDSGKIVLTSGYLSILQAMSRRRVVVGLATNPLKKDYLQEILSDGRGILADENDLTSSILEALKGDNSIMTQKAYDYGKLQTWDKLARDYLSLWGVR